MRSARSVPVRSLIISIIMTALAVGSAATSASAAPKKKEPWKAPASASELKNPVAANEKNLQAASDLYDHRCYKCHGDNGEGDGPRADDLDVKPPKLYDKDVTQQTDGALFWKIKNGRKPMPKFDNKLSDEEMWQLVNFLRTFKAGAAPKTDD